MEHVSQRGLALPELRHIREERGLSQEELAELAGLTRATIVNLERGESRARPSSAYRLAEALHAPLDALRGIIPLPSPEQPFNGVLTAYFEAAMRHARYQRAGDRRVYAGIPGMPGLWARGHTREEAERDLREALEWWTLTAVFEHRPLPAFDGASLEIVEESAAGTVTVYPTAAPSEASGLEGLEDA